MKRPFGIIILVFCLDQLTKHLVVEHFAAGGSIIPVTSFFKIVEAYNRGVSFSLFHMSSEVGFWILTSIICLITLGVFIWLLREPHKTNRVLLALIVGGSFGNLYDRFTNGAVVDFLYFFWHTYHWPAFNIADSAICIGTILMAFRSFKNKK